MHKYDFLKLAFKNKKGEYKPWVISAFALIENKGEDYYLKIIQTPTGHFFINKDGEREQIEGTESGKPPFTFQENIALTVEDCPNLKNDTVATIGNYYFNYCSLYKSFGKKIEFINTEVNVEKIEKIIANKLHDDENDLSKETEEFIYVHEYLEFAKTLEFMKTLTQLCVWAATEKTVTPPPGIEKFKKELLLKYKDRINEPSVVAEIDKQLLAYAGEWLKDDPGGQKFLSSDKSRDVAYKKLFLMQGAEAGLDDKLEIDTITNSLSQGWDVNKWTTMQNSSRAGSYNRGASTQYGGEIVKWLLRATANIRITQHDCGTRLGVPLLITKDNLHFIAKSYLVTKSGEPLLIKDETEAGQYLGKVVMKRSPMYCKLDKTDYCEVCMGPTLSASPEAPSMAVSQNGSAYMLMFMKKMHGTAMKTSHFDFREAFK